MLWRNFCCGNGCRIRRCCETMENRRNYTSSASQIQTEDKRLQSGTNSGGRTWEKAGSSREQRCSKKNSENATSESAWEQRQDSKSKGAFGVTKSWIPKKCVLVIDDIYTTGNTIHRVAKVLKNAGAQKVYFLTISIGQGL